MSNIFKKDGVKYIFASKKFQSLNTIFGISNEIKKEVNQNQKNQIKYLKNHFVDIKQEKYISFFDMSRSANIKPLQYFGEMFNKVSTLQKYAKEIGFTTPVFMTITAPSHFKPLKQIKLKKNVIKMVDNPNFWGVSDYVNLAREYQSDKWCKFLRQKIFKNMKKKYGERMVYMRTYEPMIDGTPHLHIVAFIPPEYKDRFVRLAKKYFSATRFDIKIKFNDDIGGVVAYILKYILKSFSNSKTGELDDVGYWYAYHKIRRFTTSRTLIPMKYYRLIGRLDEFKDLLLTTKLYKKDYFAFEISIDPNKALYVGFNNLTFSDYQVCEISLLIEDIDGIGFKVLYEKSENISVYEVDTRIVSKPPKFKKLDHKKPISLLFGHQYYIFKDDRFIRVNPVISHMKSYALYEYFRKLDPNDETIDLKHFALVQNECIERGLIRGEIQSPNSFNLEIGV